MNSFRWKTILIFLGVLGGGLSHEGARAQTQPPLTLWYKQPARRWVEALPLGNGRLGAMVYGNPNHEIIQLNEATLWAGGPNNNVNPQAKPYIPKIRKLIFKGDYLAAQRLANEKAGPKGNSGMPYQSAGKLIIDFFHKGSFTHYYRDLNLEKAVASDSYQIDNTHYQEQVFTSFPDQVIVIHLNASQSGKINCVLSLKSGLKHITKIKNGGLLLHGISGNHENQKGKVKYTTIVKPKLSGGYLQANDTTLSIHNADSATIYVSIATSFKNYKDVSGNDNAKAEKYLKNALKKTYQNALRDHVKAYEKYFDRLSFNLGTTDSVNNPTNVRLNEFAKDKDPELPVLYYQFGRYLLISSSQPGGQPATLQGIWNNSLNPPWDSKYTVNINTEMNYWPANKTNLSELVEPLMKMVKELSITGQQSAKQRYGARGWVLHHNTDIWRITGVVDGGYYMWPEGGTWLCENLWNHYLYTGNKKYLKKLYPILKGASKFFVDELQVEPSHHWLVVCPTMSPEHSYMRKDGTSIDMTDGATMDNQLVFDLFSNTIKAAQILHVDKQFADTLAMKRDSLPPMQIGRYDQLQEWINDWDNPNDHHRHVSHLYGLFPSNQISPYRTPKLAQAARQSLIYRGDAGTGWSTVWKANLWAHLLDGNHAHKLLKEQLRPAHESNGHTYPNLFDAISGKGSAFQIDANFGFTSAVTEMLMQSQNGAVQLLPALPDAWPHGDIKGLRTRGGFNVNIRWKKGKIKTATVYSRLGGDLRLQSYQPLKCTTTGGTLEKARGPNPNPFFKTPNIKQPIISPKAQVKELHLRKTYLYDLHTRPGKTYRLKAK